MPLFVALAMAAAEPATPPQDAPRQTIQQQFDAASKAADSGDCATAIAGFEALEHSGKVKQGSLPAATISVRKGQCLITKGRTDEGEAAILAGIQRLEAAGQTFAVDVSNANVALGDVAFARWNYSEARFRFEKALAPMQGADRYLALTRLARATAFDSGPQPLAYADEALRLMSAEAKPSKDVLAWLHTLRARIMQNRGQTQEAFDELKQALALSGGLTSSTSLNEASMRGDLGLAAMLLGRKEDARRYFAWTGAGRIEESPFFAAIAMSPPECGEETGLRPDDLAVVEFGIADGGQVAWANTIYTRGGPKVAAAFAEAVGQWAWQPETIAKIPPWYRAATRVELRCSNFGGPSPGMLSPLYERFQRWAVERAVPRFGAPSTRPGLVEELKQRLAELEQRDDKAGQAAAIGLIALVDPRSNAETIVRLDRAVALAGDGAAPAEAVNTLRILRLFASPYAEVKGSKFQPRDLRSEDVLALANDQAIAADALAQNTLRLTLGMPSRTKKESPLTQALLQKVADDDRLGEHHPLRQLALLKLANRAAAAGDLAMAQSLFAKTGLSEQQCALIGAKPAMRRTGANSGDFPLEAMQFGFEGWVHLEFDITADGRAVDARPIAAYPPFVFVDGAKRMADGFRFEASFRPTGGLACSANRQTIMFRMERY